MTEETEGRGAGSAGGGPAHTDQDTELESAPPQQRGRSPCETCAKLVLEPSPGLAKPGPTEEVTEGN